MKQDDAAAAGEALTGVESRLKRRARQPQPHEACGGEKLKADMLARMDTIEGLVKEIASRALLAEEYRES
ncbi:MAG: hypothetical protein ACLS4Z_06485 [Christensenellaceae bacterium]